MSKEEFIEHIENCSTCSTLDVEEYYDEMWDCFVNTKASYGDFLLDSMKEEQ